MFEINGRSIGRLFVSVSVKQDQLQLLVRYPARLLANLSLHMLKIQFTSATMAHDFPGVGYEIEIGPGDNARVLNLGKHNARPD